MIIFELNLIFKYYNIQILIKYDKLFNNKYINKSIWNIIIKKEKIYLLIMWNLN